MKKLKSLLIGSLILFAVSCGKDTPPPPQLIANFNISKGVISRAETIKFNDLSEGLPTEWFWTFEGGQPATSTEQNPIVKYDNTGSFDVKLIVSSGSRSDTLFRVGSVHVVEDIYSIITTKDIVYGINPEKHILDLYSPDTEMKTPLIIMMGGGGFYNGSNRELLEPFANTFASVGLSVASARYRNVALPQAPDRYQQGIVWSVQDTKAAVRFFRSNAEKYNINPNLIFIGGNSSGAIGSLIAGFYDWDEVSLLEQGIFNQHGGIEGAQGSMEYASEVAGIISLAGEMFTTLNPIDPSDPGFFGVCSTQDELIACDTRINENGFETFGAIPINEKALSVGLNSDTHIFQDGNHDTPREKSIDYQGKLLSWIQPILENPPAYETAPFLYYEDFNNDCLPAGWKTFIVANENYDWECQEREGGSLYINSYSEEGVDSPSENWLVSPKINLQGSEDPTLLFDYYLRFNDIIGYGLQLFVSESYTGNLVINDWTPISPVYDSPTASTFDSDFTNVRLNINEYANKEVNFAFRYTSSGSISNKSFETRLDNFRIMK